MPTTKPPPPFSSYSATARPEGRWAPVLDPEESKLASWRAAAPGLIGVDEAGRGPLAGPVCAAAVCFSSAMIPVGLRDSKRLSEKRRRVLAETIKGQARGWALGWASPAEIDALNILAATHLAMSRAVACLQRPEAVVLVDGNRTPGSLADNTRVGSVIKGDGRVAEISAASILAKTARDAAMLELDERYPGYAFGDHKGYPTSLHLERLRCLGPCAVHRHSFAPVRAACDQPERLL